MEQRKALEELQARIAAQTNDIPALHDEKTQLYNQIQEMRKEIEEARDGHNTKWEQYKKDMNDFMEAEKERRMNRWATEHAQ